MPPFFMATTIKVDSSVASFTWQDDQTLDKLADVDYFVVGTNATTSMFPLTTVGTGGDGVSTTSGASKIDKI
ncbi:MAG: hypothetical protein CBC13_12025 [Planctomycetia bacterium TMED53]|nr:MAG: hypothetical protein CBC13_12025 [Planctomycetia bacterium TMED53]